MELSVASMPPSGRKRQANRLAALGKLASPSWPRMLLTMSLVRHLTLRMHDSLSILMIAVALTAGAAAQGSASSAANPAKASTGQVETQAHGDANTLDSSGTNGGQVTKPGEKTSSVIGCLSGPDVDGHYTLRSMQYRSGIEVLGPQELGAAAGQKVKLTGLWAPETQSKTDTQRNTRRFQVASFDQLADQCSPPAETTPISKTKQKQQKAAAGQKAGNNPQ